MEGSETYKRGGFKSELFQEFSDRADNNQMNEIPYGLVDWDQVDLILQDDLFEGTPNEIKSIYRDFIEEAKRHLQEMEECVRDQNTVALARKAHQLKGIAATLGMRDFCLRLSRLEQSTASSPLILPALYYNAVSSFQKTVVELTKKYPILL